LTGPAEDSRSTDRPYPKPVKSDKVSAGVAVCVEFTSLAQKVMKKSLPTSWWEEGYDRDAALSRGDDCQVSKFLYDGNGENFLLQTVETDLHHLDAKFFNHLRKIAILSEPGGVQHQRHSSISIYVLESGQMILEKSFQVGDNSGYFSISNDDKLLAISILKEDGVMIYDIDAEDLLVDINGGGKLGFWGQTRFLPHVTNNSLMEFRILEMDRGRAKGSALRLWDLGFKPSSDSDDDDNEVEVKVWQKKCLGPLHYCVCTNDLVMTTSETTKKIEWLSLQKGEIRRSLTLDKWVSKAIVSTCGRYVAVSHTGHSAVWDVVNGVVLSEISTPDPTASVYPLVPIAFVNNDKWLLLRVYQDMSIVLCNWRYPHKHTITIRHIGGTISDNTVAISHDEAYLICWPYGKIQLYDFGRMKEVLRRKESSALRIECVLMRALCSANRARLLNEKDPALAPLRFVFMGNLYDIFYLIASYL
jgi:hypothetical protein